jgi:hypothetical protein
MSSEQRNLHTAHSIQFNYQIKVKICKNSPYYASQKVEIWKKNTAK